MFADDGSNEIADYIIVHEEAERTRVQLVHCKAARSADVPADRVDDLYEVLGQAVKCRRWLDARRMLKQVKHRAANAKGSQFLKGDLGILSSLLSDVTRLVYEVVIVQPSVAPSRRTPSSNLCTPQTPTTEAPTGFLFGF